MSNSRFKILLLIIMTSTLFAKNSINENLQKQYQKIASSFIKHYAIQNFSEWRDAKIANMTPFYTTNGSLIGYEASIVTNKLPEKEKGYLFMGIPNEIPLINSFSTTGGSISKILLDFWEKTYAPEVIESGLEILEFKFLFSPPSGYAIGIQLNGEAPFLEKAIFQDHYYIFSPFPDYQSYNYSFQPKKATRSFIERNNFKQSLLKNDFNNSLFQLKEKHYIKQKKTTRDIQSISGSFAPLYQELRRWNNDDIFSLAGCTPIAWSILYEYWDERGYPNLVGPSTNNYHHETFDPNIRYMVSRLRKYMPIKLINIDGTIMTGVDTKHIPLGIKYAYERGYPHFTAFNSSHANAWNSLKLAVKRNQPPIASYKPSKYLHTAIVYQYFDYEGTANDFFCVRKGWKSVPQECKHVSYLNVVTIVQPESSKQKDLYGSIAIAKKPNDIIIGASWFSTSREYVIQKALDNCRAKTSSQCYTIKLLKNECVALAQIPYYNKGTISTSPILNNAQNNALKGCNKRTENNNCFIRLAFCSDKKGSIYHNSPKNDASQKQKINIPTKKSEYAAIAIAVNNGRLLSWGRSWHKATLNEAKKYALESCGKSICKLIVTGRNQCISLAKIAYKDKGNFFKANDPYTAKSQALKLCTKRNEGRCFTVTTVCTNGNH